MTVRFLIAALEEANHSFLLVTVIVQARHALTNMILKFSKVFPLPVS